MNKTLKFIYVSCILTCFAALLNAEVKPAAENALSAANTANSILPSSGSVIPSSVSIIPSSGSILPSSAVVIPSSGIVSPPLNSVALSSGSIIPSSGAVSNLLPEPPAEPSGVKFVPYFSFNVMDACSIPTKGDTLFPLNLTNDIGLMASVDEKNSIVGFYELKYTGPGFKKEEGLNFTDRMMDHVLVLREEHKLGDKYLLKTQLDYMREYTRTGANEVWGQGLYDFNRTGVAVFLKKQYSSDLSGEVSLQFHTLLFPNYTDLLAEYQAGVSAESSSGKQNQNVYQAGLSAQYGRNAGSVGVMLMDYTKQKVIVQTVQPDGTYYSGTLQRDSLITFNASREDKLWNTIFLAPSFSYKYKTSNQNFQDFSTPTSTVPVQYLGSYYDYNEIDVSIPCNVAMSKKWEYFISYEYDWKGYMSRPPRDPDGNFISGKQANILSIWGTGFIYKPNEVTRTTFFYQYQGAESNMKFEKYLPYNYGGNTFGVNFSYSY